jgi:hypothetical protein
MLLLLSNLAHAEELPGMLNGAGSPIRWTQMPISFKVDPTNEAGLDADRAVVAVAQGAGAWNDIPESSVKLRFLGTGKDFPVGHDDVNGVTFVADWTLDADALAVTSVWTTTDGTALGFDMQVNTADHAWGLDGRADVADLQSAMAHEFGHVLGIGHLEKPPEATMYPSSAFGETHKRDLTDDDRWVAMNFYPAVAEVPGQEGGAPLEALCASAGGVTSSAATAGGIAIAALLARRRRPSTRTEKEHA